MATFSIKPSEQVVSNFSALDLVGRRLYLSGVPRPLAGYAWVVVKDQPKSNNVCVVESDFGRAELPSGTQFEFTRGDPWDNVKIVASPPVGSLMMAVNRMGATSTSWVTMPEIDSVDVSSIQVSGTAAPNPWMIGSPGQRMSPIWRQPESLTGAGNMTLPTPATTGGVSRSIFPYDTVPNRPADDDWRQQILGEFVPRSPQRSEEDSAKIAAEFLRSMAQKAGKVNPGSPEIAKILEMIDARDRRDERRPAPEPVKEVPKVKPVDVEEELPLGHRPRRVLGK